jgi:hypothetical protein
MVMVLAVLVASITATGYADPLGPNEQLSGPALVGTLEVRQHDGDRVDIRFVGKCRGDAVSETLLQDGLLPGGLTVAEATATSLEGLRFPNAGPFGCLFKDVSGGDLIVNTVVSPTFVNTGTQITANVVLLHVVPL